MDYKVPSLPLPCNLETREVFVQLIRSNRALAELKGGAHLIPNEDILVNTLTLQEARESSMVENIVTTQDDLYKAQLNLRDAVVSPATKEVLNYRTALHEGWRQVMENRLLTNRIILSIQERLEENRAGFRAVPGTTLRNNKGEVIYTPPQDGQDVRRYMDNLERFINDDDVCPYDPLIKMAVIHHQFESIHPFYDGNGRTGRVINVLYLVRAGLLDTPTLYLSRYITRNKGAYYRLIQAIRETPGDNTQQWVEWVLFMLKGVEETAAETLNLIRGIAELMARFKEVLRPEFGRVYKHEMLNSLFSHPYTKIEHMAKNMQVQRQAASHYLDRIVELGLLRKEKVWKSNYYINDKLVSLLCGDDEVKPLSFILSQPR